MIKISILKDEDGYAYMEYQTGNDPRIFNSTFGSSGYQDLEELFKFLLDTYGDTEIVLTNNL